MTEPRRSSPVGRLAPSPTGAQHVGNARTYLVAWLAARSAHGRLPLRIENIDTWRNRRNAHDQALVDLTWLGLDWDGPPRIQTDSLAAHRAALQLLQDHELVYPCTCSRSDVADAASAPHAEHEGPVYPGTCAGRSVADANTLPPGFCWRFRVRHSPTFTDQVRGHVAVDLQALGGDFVVWRRDGMPAYQLAVVVDDAAEGVTEVIRGDDLIPSTPRQILLQQALGYPTPRYAHLPLVVGVDGRRLAKRHGDTRLAALRQVQVSAEALVGVLAWSLGWLAEPEPMTPHQLLPIFRWDTLTRTPFVLTPDILARIGYPTSMRDHTSP